jgi:hypothetical protein
MASNRFAFTGLEELRQALRTLPDDLANEAGVIVQQHAHTAAAAVQAAYAQHRDSGELADGVVVEQADAGRFGVGMVVRSKAKHAWLFDNGSQARHQQSGDSTGVMWGAKGAEPPTHVFVKTMMAFRRSMYVELANLLRTHGLIVSESGDDAA